MSDPAQDRLQVTAFSISAPPGRYSSFTVHGVVTAPGLPPTPVERTGIARQRTWPTAGDELPVTFDRLDPARLQIDWRRRADR